MQPTTIFGLLATAIICDATVLTPALGGANLQTRDNSLYHNRLSVRDGYNYCAATGYATYCLDKACCGTENCMPYDAECCSNGQFCLSGTTCLVTGIQAQCLSEDNSNSGSASNSGSTSKNHTVSRKPKIGIIIGGVIGALALLGVLATAVILFLKKKSNAKKNARSNISYAAVPNPAGGPMNPGVQPMPPPPMMGQQPPFMNQSTMYQPPPAGQQQWQPSFVPAPAPPPPMVPMQDEKKLGYYSSATPVSPAMTPAATASPQPYYTSPVSPSGGHQPAPFQPPPAPAGVAEAGSGQREIPNQTFMSELPGGEVQRKN